MIQDNHINAFTISHGLPRLLGEYIDYENFKQIDTSMINNYISINKIQDSNRVLFDITIDNINNLKSNLYMYKHLLRVIADKADILKGKLDVIKNNIIAEVFYQIEDPINGKILKRSSTKFSLGDRTYFSDMSPSDDVFEKTIVSNVNNSDTISINVNSYCNRDQLIRLTHIDLYYPIHNLHKRNYVNNLDYNDPKCYPHGFQIHHHDQYCDIDHAYDYLQYDGNPCTTNIIDQFDDLHDPRYNQYPVDQYYSQSRHCHCPPYYNHNCIPYGDYNENIYYQWGNNYKDIFLHEDEIENEQNIPQHLHLTRIPYNRAISRVRYGTRVTFKISLWNNDVILVKDTSEIARLMGVGKNIGIVERLNELESEIDKLQSTNAQLTLQFASLDDKIDNDLVNKSFADRTNGSVVGNDKYVEVLPELITFREEKVNVSNGEVTHEHHEISSDGNILFNPNLFEDGEVSGYNVSLNPETTILRNEFNEAINDVTSSTKTQLNEIINSLNTFKTSIEDTLLQFQGELDKINEKINKESEVNE